MDGSDVRHTLQLKHPNTFPGSYAARVSQLCYAASAHVRLYGEDFYVVSDPFPEAGGMAVRITFKNNSAIRVLRLPATVLQRLCERTTNAA